MEIAVKKETIQAVFDYLAGKPWREVNHLIVALNESRLIEESTPTIEEVTTHVS
jgi:hypothetical protein